MTTRALELASTLRSSMHVGSMSDSVYLCDRFLIAFSYELSKKEGRVGEKPACTRAHPTHAGTAHTNSHTCAHCCRAVRTARNVRTSAQHIRNVTPVSCVHTHVLNVCFLLGIWACIYARAETDCGKARVRGHTPESCVHVCTHRCVQVSVSVCVCVGVGVGVCVYCTTRALTAALTRLCGYIAIGADVCTLC